MILFVIQWTLACTIMEDDCHMYIIRYSDWIIYQCHFLIRYRFKYHASQITLHSTIQFLFQTPGLLNTFFDQVEFVVMKITYFFLQILVKEMYKKCKISQAYFLMPKKFVQFPVSDWIVRTIWQDWFITWLTFKLMLNREGECFFLVVVRQAFAVLSIYFCL